MLTLVLLGLTSENVYCQNTSCQLETRCLIVLHSDQDIAFYASAPTYPGLELLLARNQVILLTGLATNLSTTGTEVPGQFTCASQGCPNLTSRRLTDMRISERLFHSANKLQCFERCSFSREIYGNDFLGTLCKLA